MYVKIRLIFVVEHNTRCTNEVKNRAEICFLGRFLTSLFLLLALFLARFEAQNLVLITNLVILVSIG